MPERLELRLGDAILEDDAMPLHFYGLQGGSKINVVKPYISVTVQKSNGSSIFWRIYRKDTVKQTKVKLSTAASLAPNAESISAEASRLFTLTEDQNYLELDDEETIEQYKFQDGARLYILTYRWSYDHQHSNEAFVTKTGNLLEGVGSSDTGLAIKLRVQDQLGIPVSALKVFHGRLQSQFPPKFWKEVKYYVSEKEVPDGASGQKLVVITEEELTAEQETSPASPVGQLTTVGQVGRVVRGNLPWGTSFLQAKWN